MEQAGHYDTRHREFQIQIYVSRIDYRRYYEPKNRATRSNKYH